MLCLALAACGGGGGGSSGGNASPTASFELSASEILVNQELVLNAAASRDPDGEIRSYRWTFADGSSAEGVVASRRFAAAGRQTITLEVTDDTGASSRATRTVLVRADALLSGVIRVAASVRTDSDVNDPRAALADNNSAESAQPLANPATLNGFVSTEPSGEAGDRFADAADPRDVFRVELQENQQISLQISDYDRDNTGSQDIDLWLYDSGRDLVAWSEGQGEFESISVATAGSYFLVVESVSGASKYVLSIGNQLLPGAEPVSSSSADFRPNEFLLQLRDAASSAGAGGDTLELLRGRWGVRLQRAGGRRGVLLSALADSDTCSSLLDRLQPGRAAPFRRGAMAGAGDRPGPLGSADAKTLTIKLIKALRRRSDTLFVEPNYRVRATAEPADGLYRRQWHYPFINLPLAWDVTTGERLSAPPIVAVLDTGVLLAHPDLAGRIVGGYDFISDPQVAADGDGIDANPDDPGDRRGPSQGSSFHGTHVAGTVAARSDNGTGVAGVSWGARIMPVRVLGVDGGSSYDLAQGIRYAAGLDNASGQLPLRRADIINLSLGCADCYSRTLQQAITAARNAGVIVVAAAGNAGNSQNFYPAAYDGVVGVGAVHSGGGRAAYSNFGSFVDVVAPGGDDQDRNGDGYPDRILSTLGEGSSGSVVFRYGWSSGTSMAAPHVAGVAALMLAVYPGMTPGEFDLALAGGLMVNDLGPPGRDPEFGSGLIDAFKAVQLASSYGSGQATGSVSASPATLNFSAGVIERSVLIGPQGVDPPMVTGVFGDRPWLSVTPEAEVDGSGFGPYRVRVDREGLAPSVYDGQIEVRRSDGGVLRLPVYLEVSSDAAGAGDAGVVYVLLIDADTLAVLQQADARRTGPGLYEFEFRRPPSSRRLRLFAGSDIDNDLVICSSGETCGAYPTLGEDRAFQLEADRSDMGFGLSVRSDFGLSAAGAGGASVTGHSRRR